MNKIHHLERGFMHLRSFNVLRANLASARYFSSIKDSNGGDKESPLLQPEAAAEIKNVENLETSKSKTKLSGFAQSYEKFAQIDNTKKEMPKTFFNLFRNSKFVDLGDPEGKLVVGKIFHVVNDDLYIDFGWKFHCVCRKPIKNGQYYVRGAKVRLRIKDLEISSKFLGATTDISLLEADCTLMGLIWSPLQMAEDKRKTKIQNTR